MEHNLSIFISVGFLAIISMISILNLLFYLCAQIYNFSHFSYNN